MKLMRIRLLNFALFGESRKEDFDRSEIEKLRRIPLAEVRKELRELSDDYIRGLCDECRKRCHSQA